MGKLLDTYNAMQKEAEEAVEEVTKTAEEDEILQKYAEFADAELAKEYKEDYTKEDVIKLAQKLIDRDIAIQENIEKVAELQEAGIIMAKAFKVELSQTEDSE